jgi:AraC family transcriptional regulator
MGQVLTHTSRHNPFAQSQRPIVLMINLSQRSYQNKFCKVLEYIEQHLDNNPSMEELSAVAHSSKFHFHRQFTYFIGMSPARYMLLMKLKRSAFQLAFRQHLKIIDIAMQAGFENPESFSRAFKRVTALSPSKFRQTPAWTYWQNKPIKNYMDNSNMQNTNDHSIKIVDFPLTRLAVMEHRGYPKHVYNTIQKFIDWRKINGPSPKQSRTFNILYDDPQTTPAAHYRFDVAASIKGDVADNDASVVQKAIPKGRCAVLRVTGDSEQLADSIAYLFSHWLPQSGEELRDFPLFVERLTLFPDVAEHEMLTDIYLPLN